jgi:spore coat polysaccharide biosynthesis protein SpsF
MPKIIAVIQSRLGSTRLPGKALLPILGQPMLARIIERLWFSRRIDDILLSTTESPQDDALVSAAAEMGISASRGPVDHIVERLHRAAVASRADILVRVWGDCPCVDPVVIDAAIDLHAARE